MSGKGLETKPAELRILKCRTCLNIPESFSDVSDDSFFNDVFGLGLVLYTHTLDFVSTLTVKIREDLHVGNKLVIILIPACTSTLYPAPGSPFLGATCFKFLSTLKLLRPLCMRRRPHHASYARDALQQLFRHRCRCWIHPVRGMNLKTTF